MTDKTLEKCNLKPCSHETKEFKMCETDITVNPNHCCKCHPEWCFDAFGRRINNG